MTPQEISDVVAWLVSHRQAASASQERSEIYETGKSRRTQSTGQNGRDSSQKDTKWRKIRILFVTFELRDLIASESPRVRRGNIMAANEPGSTQSNRRQFPGAVSCSGLVLLLNGDRRDVAGRSCDRLCLLEFPPQSRIAVVDHARRGGKFPRKSDPAGDAIVIRTLGPGMARRRIFPVGCGGSRARNFRSSRSIARISAVRCDGSRSRTCSCVRATAAPIMKMVPMLPDRRRAGFTNTI